MTRESPQHEVAGVCSWKVGDGYIRRAGYAGVWAGPGRYCSPPPPLILVTVLGATHFAHDTSCDPHTSLIPILQMKKPAPRG